MCYYRENNGICRKYTDVECTSYCVDGPCPDNTPTNADRIRGMGDEELVRAMWEFWMDFHIEDIICGEKNCSDVKQTKFEDKCCQYIFEYRKQPAETEG